MHTEVDVVVVGGGLAGVACAVALSDQGQRVSLLEAGAELGGRACSWADPTTGDMIDLGPHIFLSEYPNMLALLERLGTRGNVVWQTDKLITLVENGSTIDMRIAPLTPPLHLLPSMAKVPGVSLKDLYSNRRVLRLALTLDEAQVGKLDDVPAHELLKEYGVTRRFREWFWATASMALMNVPLEQCSAGALLRVFAELLNHRRYAIGFADRGLAELYAAPARRLIEHAGGQVTCRTRVAAVDLQNGRVNALRLQDGTSIRVAKCVLAVSPDALAQILPERRLARTDPEQFQPSPYISTYLWFDRRLPAERFWARVWSPDNLNYDFYDLTAIRRGWQNRSSVVASNIIYSHRAHPLSDDEVIAVTRRELAEAVPQSRDAGLVHAVVNRIPMAIPCPRPGMERLRPPAASAVGGLWIAGDWTDTRLPCSMESAVRSGFLAAEAILAHGGVSASFARMPSPPQGLAAVIKNTSRWFRRMH